MARALAIACALVSALVGSGCDDAGSGGADAAVTDGLRIAVEPPFVAMAPGARAVAAFRLVDGSGRPVSDRVIQLVIVDDPSTPANDAQGATLGFDRAVSDGRGEVRLPITAGLATTFKVRASAAEAEDVDLVVVVQAGEFARVEVVPVLALDKPAYTWASTRVAFYDGMTCATVGAGTPAPVRPVRNLPPAGTTIVDAVAIGSSHAALATAVDESGTARYGGCVDVPGASLLEREVVRVPIPLAPVAPNLAGSYRVVSELQFVPPPPGAVTLGAAWTDLAACPLDPARLWLDCTIDALVSSDADPLDCRPAAEGQLGAALLARRGIPAAGADAKCRSAQDAVGAASLDALAAALFSTPGPPAFAGLPAIGREASRLFDSMKLRSLLTVAPSTASGRYELAHTIEVVELPIGTEFVKADLVALAPPVRTASAVAATVRGTDLDVARHGFALRLGSAARHVFGNRSLAARGAPAGVSDFVGYLFGLAQTSRGGVTLAGCDALDAQLCADVGSARGCLSAACSAGLVALAQKLEAGFTALDGTDLDLFLAGAAAILDRDGDGVVDALGRIFPEPARPGVWSGELRGRGGEGKHAGIWVSVRAQ